MLNLEFVLQIMQALVDKYSMLSSQSAAEMQNENQKNIEAVVEKCLSILETQVERITRCANFGN